MICNSELRLLPVGNNYKSVLPSSNINTPPREMDAWVSYNNGKTFLEKVPVPGMLDQDVLIEVLWTSICPSDIKRLTDMGPDQKKAILGHEFAGRVVSVGKNADADLLGQIVAIEEHYPCLNCSECKMGQFDRCKREGFLGWYRSGNPDDWLRNGSFAEYVSIHHSCAKRTEGIEELDFLPSLAEPFGNAVKMEMSIREECKEMPETVILWGGCGFQGSYMSAYLSCKGVKNLILLDKNRANIRYMREQLKELNARFFLLDIEDHEMLVELKKRLRQEGGFINIDLTGDYSVLELNLKYAAPEGKVFFFGLPDNHKKTTIPGTKINLFDFLTGKAGINHVSINDVRGIGVMGRDNETWNKTIEVIKKDKSLRRFIMKPVVLAGSNKNIGQLIEYIKSNGSRFDQAPFGLRPGKFAVTSEKILEKIQG